MISTLKSINAASASGEVWKYLRFFLNTDKTAARIREIHKIGEGVQKRNIEKQARQVAYSIRQAEQYFRASTLVDLTTRPLLLYYGSVSLSQALVLLKNDGTYSLDAARKAKKHRHHGLELHGRVESAAGASSFRQFWEAITCSVYKKDSGELWGHFCAFYRSLDQDAYSHLVQFQNFGDLAYLDSERIMPVADLLPVDTLSQHPVKAYDLIKTLPDMYTTLMELGQESQLRPGNIKRTITNYYRPNPNAPDGRELDHISDSSHFFVDAINKQDQAELTAFYESRNANIKKRWEYPTNIYFGLDVNVPAGAPHDVGYYPDIVMDIYSKKYYILKPEQYVPEAAAFAILLFALGMISRYYPDIWMRNVDANVEMAEVTNAFLNLSYRKFPNLILDQMTGTKHVIKE